MAQGMELLDNGTKVFTGPGAAFGTDALLLARFAMPRRKETTLDLCSGCGIVALAWHDAGHRGPCTAVELDADASALCRRAVQETPGAEHITALCTDLRTFCKSGPEQMAAVFAALCAVGLEPKRVALVRKDEHSKPWLFLVEAQKGRKPGIRWEEDVLTGNGVRYGR